MTETNLMPVVAAGLAIAVRRPIVPAENASNSDVPELKLKDLLTSPSTTPSDQNPIKISADFLVPKWDRDYQHPTKHVHGLDLTRGGLTYQRPFGWWRVALSVKGKFGDDDAWLGSPGTGSTLRETRINSDEGEWAVSYFGIGQESPAPPTHQGLLVSTPFPKLAKGHADEFICDGRVYKMALQLRVDPTRTEKIQDGDYYVTKELSAVRPYGLLVLDLGSAEERNRRRNRGKVSMAVMLQNVLDKMREEAA